MQSLFTEHYFTRQIRPGKEGKMKVYIFTIPPHQVGSRTAEGYDGPFTDMSVPLLQTIDLLESDRYFSGQMGRHYEAARVIAADLDVRCDQRVGNDKILFNALLKDDQEILVTGFEKFLDHEKKHGTKSLTLITDREYAMLMTYLEQGGESALGQFGEWYKAIKDKKDLPCTRQGTILSYDY